VRGKPTQQTTLKVRFGLVRENDNLVPGYRALSTKTHSKLFVTTCIIPAWDTIFFAEFCSK